jgi:hypothetical protein
MLLNNILRYQNTKFRNEQEFTRELAGGKPEMKDMPADLRYLMFVVTRSKTVK